MKHRMWAIQYIQLALEDIREMWRSLLGSKTAGGSHKIEKGLALNWMRGQSAASMVYIASATTGVSCVMPYAFAALTYNTRTKFVEKRAFKTRIWGFSFRAITHRNEVSYKANQVSKSAVEWVITHWNTLQILFWLWIPKLFFKSAVADKLRTTSIYLKEFTSILSGIARDRLCNELSDDFKIDRNGSFSQDICSDSSQVWGLQWTAFEENLRKAPVSITLSAPVRCATCRARCASKLEWIKKTQNTMAEWKSEVVLMW